MSSKHEASRSFYKKGIQATCLSPVFFSPPLVLPTQVLHTSSTQSKTQTQHNTQHNMEAPHLARFCRWPGGCPKAIQDHNDSGLCPTHRYRQLYRERKAAGLCVRCARDRPRENPAFCNRCVPIAAANARNTRLSARLRAEAAEAANINEVNQIRHQVRTSIRPVEWLGDSPTAIRTAFQAAEMGIPIRLQLRDPAAVWFYRGAHAAAQVHANANAIAGANTNANVGNVDRYLQVQIVGEAAAAAAAAEQYPGAAGAGELGFNFNFHPGDMDFNLNLNPLGDFNPPAANFNFPAANAVDGQQPPQLTLDPNLDAAMPFPNCPEDPLEWIYADPPLVPEDLELLDPFLGNLTAGGPSPPEGEDGQ